MRKSYLVITRLLLSLFGAPYIVSGNDLPEFSSRSTSLGSGALSASEGSSSISYVEQQENVVQETPKLITQQSNGLQLSEAAFDPPRIEKEATGPNYYGDSLSTTGTATDNRDVEYPGITVYLFLDNPVGDIIDAVDNSITDSNGDYTLNFPAFTTADLGTHSWSVWYPNQDAGDPEFGIDCFNCNKTVANGSFSLFDEIDFDVLFANTVDLSPADNLEFTSSVELSNTDPLPPAVLSNFSISYDIDYQDPSLTDVVDATASFTTASIVETIPYPGTSEATATITVDIVGSATNYVINAPTQYSGVFNIITEFTFTIGNIDISGETGTPFTKTQLEGDQFFSRTNQLVTLSGTYISTSLGANASHWNNVPVQVSISGSGLTDSSLDSSGLATNASGIFVYSFSIDPTKFNDPGPNGAISITIQIFETFDNLLPAEEVKTLTIKLKAEADVFNNVQYTGDLNGSSYTPLYYFRGDGSSFQITGEVLDEQSLGARGVRINLFVTNQT
ncbi:MAG: hypothetical protein ACXAE3_16330, partial [Candidatus Kariarchaeaceae archaeon]